MKKALAFLDKHKKILIVLCCTVIIGASVYSDFCINRTKKVAASSYLYNADFSSDGETPEPTETKILGEARLVDNVISEKENDAYFSSAVLNRERSRSEALETLQIVIDSSETMPDVKDEALSRMIDMASAVETEALTEEMLKAKGFEPCLAIVQGDSVSVIVQTPGLLTNEVAQITEIVMEGTGFSPDNIKIIEKN